MDLNALALFHRTLIDAQKVLRAAGYTITGIERDGAPLHPLGDFGDKIWVCAGITASTYRGRLGSPRRFMAIEHAIVSSNMIGNFDPQIPPAQVRLVGLQPEVFGNYIAQIALLLEANQIRCQVHNLVREQMGKQTLQHALQGICELFRDDAYRSSRPQDLWDDEMGFRSWAAMGERLG